MSLRTDGKTTGIVTEKAAVDLQNVLKEACLWIKEVTGKKVEPSNFRAELENGIILCELIEKVHPGCIRRINRMNIAMAHLDNLKQFLNGCEKFGLKDSQLFDVTDLQVQSTLRIKSGGIKHTTADRRLRNVCVTIFWLGRKLSMTPSYTGAQLNLDAFKEILDLPVSSTNFYLKGYEQTPVSQLPNNHSQSRNHTPTSNIHSKLPSNHVKTKQMVVTTTCEIDLEPMSPPKRVEIKTIQKEPDVTKPLEVKVTSKNEIMPVVIDLGKSSPIMEVEPVVDDNDLTPDELIATIQNAVDELLLDYKYEDSANDKMPTTKIDTNDYLDRKERSFSSPSPTSLSSPSPPVQPAPLILDIHIMVKQGVSLGLQLIGGADTAIPAQVEVVMPGKPAEAGGLKAGDIIVSVNEQDVTRMTHHQLIDFIKRSVGLGNLTLGVERSVELPGRIPKNDASIIYENITDQTKKIDQIYKENNGVSRVNGNDNKTMPSDPMPSDPTSPDPTPTYPLPPDHMPPDHMPPDHMPSDPMLDGNYILEDTFDKNTDEDSDTSTVDEEDEYASDELEVGMVKDVDWQSPNRLSTKESVSRLEEELEALTNLVNNKSTVTPPITSGIGGIEPKVVTETVTMTMNAPILHSENDIVFDQGAVSLDDSSSDNGRSLEGNVSDNVPDDTPAMMNVSIPTTTKTDTFTISNMDMPSSIKVDSNIKLTTPTIATTTRMAMPTYVDMDVSNKMSALPSPTMKENEIEDDPFAPIQRESTSSHLLSDVLNLHKSDFPTTGNYNNQMPTYAKVVRSKRSHSSSSSSSKSYQNNTPTQFKNTGSTHSSASLQPRQQPPSQMDFELQDELQEMHGIKVRQVQRTRWSPASTPPSNEPVVRSNTSRHPPPPLTHSSSVKQSMLEKKSSIYERRDVVLMEVRGRGWTNSNAQNSSYYRQDSFKRPWSSQPRKFHQACSHCRGPIYQGPMMAIADKNLYFHSKCLVCVVCRSPVSLNYGRATVFLRHSLPHCTSCYSNDNGIKVTTC